MTPTVLHLTSLSAKIALLGGLAWMQLYLLRRAPAASRSRLCSLALMAIVLLAAGEWAIAPSWLVKTPVFYFTANAAHQAPPAAARTSASSWIGLLWMSGVLFMLARVVAGRITLSMLRRRSTLLDRVSSLDIRTGKVETPILSGLLRPAILLPASAREWTDEQRRMVLTHELTHFRQGDCWSNLLAQTVRAAFWFHPIVWLLVSRMSREQELTCDEAVVASGHSRHDYAAFLLDTVRNLRSREMFACSMAGSGSRSLQQRFANLLDTRPRPALTSRLAASIAVFAALATMLAVVRPVWSQNKEEKKDGAYKVGNGVLPPKVLSKVDPDYTQEDRDARIEGAVVLKAIITAAGSAENITVVRSVSPGLDQKAIEALQKWTFQPGTKDGQAVPVWATVEINFRLK
jgi:bla regulator protein blaR1